MSRTSKLLLFLAIAAVVVIGGIWIYGNKKSTYETRLTIAAPPDYVFTFLSDYEKHKEWMTGLVEVKDLEPTASEDLMGQRNKVIIEQGGSGVGFTNEIIRYTENSALSIRSTNASVANTLVFKLDELKSGSTELTYKFHVVNVGLGKLLNVFFSNGDRQAIISEEARKLKSIVEAKYAEDPTVKASEAAGQPGAADGRQGKTDDANDEQD